MGALTGTAALVTGGGSGIGLACARRLAADHLRRGPDYRAIFEPLFGADALRGVIPEE